MAFMRYFLMEAVTQFTSSRIAGGLPLCLDIVMEIPGIRNLNIYGKKIAWLWYLVNNFEGVGLSGSAS